MALAVGQDTSRRHAVCLVARVVRPSTGAMAVPALSGTSLGPQLAQSGGVPISSVPQDVGAGVSSDPAARATAPASGPERC